jgi:hypothetical protein
LLLSVARFCSISCDDAPLQGAAQAGAGDVCSLTEPSSVRLRACDHARAGRIFCGHSSPADRPRSAPYHRCVRAAYRTTPAATRSQTPVHFLRSDSGLRLDAHGNGRDQRGISTGIDRNCALRSHTCGSGKASFSPDLPRPYYAVALAIGFDSAPEPSSTGVLIKALAGTGIMVIFLVFDLAYYTRLAMGRPWLRVGVRVLGSWIIAISFLVLALSLLSSPTEMASQKR